MPSSCAGAGLVDWSTAAAAGMTRERRASLPAGRATPDCAGARGAMVAAGGWGPAAAAAGSLAQRTRAAVGGSITEEAAAWPDSMEESVDDREPVPSCLSVFLGCDRVWRSPQCAIQRRGENTSALDVQLAVPIPTMRTLANFCSCGLPLCFTAHCKPDGCMLLHRGKGIYIRGGGSPGAGAQQILRWASRATETAGQEVEWL